MNGQESKGGPAGQGITRRKVLTAGGVALVGATVLGPLLGNALAQAAGGQDMRRRGVTSKEGGTKPTFLPEAGSNDPVAHSIAENLFWNEQLMEHAQFFVMLMPGPELAGPRGQAERFQQTFAGQLGRARAAGIDRENYAAFNRSTVELVKPYADFKHRMRDEQAAGRLQSLVWPSFFEHTAREAERFARRLDQFSRGDTSTDVKEAAEFWASSWASTRTSSRTSWTPKSARSSSRRCRRATPSAGCTRACRRRRGLSRRRWTTSSTSRRRPRRASRPGRSGASFTRRSRTTCGARR